MAVEQNITAADAFFLGEDKTLTFTITNTAGAAQNITGWALSWMLKRSGSDADSAALVTKTVGFGITLTTPGSGVCTVTVADTDTAALKPRVYEHELKRTDDGFETVLTYGTCDLGRGVHH